MAEVASSIIGSSTQHECQVSLSFSLFPEPRLAPAADSLHRTRKTADSCPEWPCSRSGMLSQPEGLPPSALSLNSF